PWWVLVGVSMTPPIQSAIATARRCASQVVADSPYTKGIRAARRISAARASPSSSDAACPPISQGEFAGSLPRRNHRSPRAQARLAATIRLLSTDNTMSSQMQPQPRQDTSRIVWEVVTVAGAEDTNSLAGVL